MKLFIVLFLSLLLINVQSARFLQDEAAAEDNAAAAVDETADKAAAGDLPQLNQVNPPKKADVDSAVAAAIDNTNKYAVPLFSAIFRMCDNLAKNADAEQADEAGFYADADKVCLELGNLLSKALENIPDFAKPAILALLFPEEADASDDETATAEEAAPAEEAAAEDTEEAAPAEEPAAEQPAAEQPPAEEPAAEQPPAEQPAAEQPPAEQPSTEAAEAGEQAAPADQPPAEQPPADQLPADQPPADQPPADQPPADQPPAEQPVVDAAALGNQAGDAAAAGEQAAP